MQISGTGASPADYDAWLNAVDAALKSGNRGFTVASIDGMAAHAAFTAGTSPVVYARSVQMKPRPAYPRQPVFHGVVVTPSPSVIRWTYIFLSFSGWLFWCVGIFGTLFAILNLIYTLIARRELLWVGVLATFIQMGIALCVLVAGSLWQYLAQRLALAYIESPVSQNP